MLQKSRRENIRLRRCYSGHLGADPSTAKPQSERFWHFRSPSPETRVAKLCLISKCSCKVRMICAMSCHLDAAFGNHTHCPVGAAVRGLDANHLSRCTSVCCTARSGSASICMISIRCVIQFLRGLRPLTRDSNKRSSSTLACGSSQPQITPVTWWWFAARDVVHQRVLACDRTLLPQGAKHQLVDIPARRPPRAGTTPSGRGGSRRPGAPHWPQMC